MRICIVTSSFPSRRDDVVQAPFLIEFIEGLKKWGHDVFVFTQDREGLKQKVLEGVDVRWFRWMGSKRPLVHLTLTNPLDCLRICSLVFRGRGALLAYLQEKRIEVCLALWVLPSGYFANYACRRAGIPYSIWALGSDIYRYGENPFLYPLMNRILQEARTIFADGFDLTQKIEERFRRSSSFLATTRTLPTREEKPRPQPSSPYRFLFVGRLERVKGIDLLLQAMAGLNEEGSDARLTVVGGGGVKAWAKEFIEKRGLGSKVTMLGNVPDEILSSLYASSDCVVIPSRSESIPLVFSEALNFDREMIVTDVGDLGRLGRDYGVAEVIPPEDPAALLRALRERVRQNRETRTIRDNEKRTELKQLFRMETSVERFLADYR